MWHPLSVHRRWHGPGRPVPTFPLPGRWWAILATQLLLALAGCASLPDLDHELAPSRAQAVRFETASGPLSAAKSETVLRKLEQQKTSTDMLQKHLAFEEAINPESPLILGNKVTLLLDGPATYQAMFEAMRAAKHHINLETYIFEDDEIGNKFADLLLERRAAGIEVNLIYDSVGTDSTPRDFFTRLADGGVRTLEFNPVNPLELRGKEWILNNRDHRKLLIVDGRVAFLGGINISSVYSGSSVLRKGKSKDKDKGVPNPKGNWRDTHTRIEGPVVAELQKLFMATWEQQKGPPLAPRSYFPELKNQGSDIVRAIGSSPQDQQNLIYLTLVSAITHAEQNVHLTNAYFVPDPQFFQALLDAAGRGVDVRLILPSKTDSWVVFHAGRSYYTELLRAGVKVYERRDAILHAKTVSIDGVWSTVGSANLDWRSFLHNNELNAVILGRDFARQMDAMFAKDLDACDAIELEKWEKRSVILRLKEWVARLPGYWL